MSQQVTITDQAKGFAGQRMGLRHESRSLANNQGKDRQVTDVVIDNVINATTYTFTLEGVTVSFTSDASATAVEIRDGLIADARSSAVILAAVTVNPAGNNVRVTALEPGVAFALSESDANLSLSVVQANVATEPLPFGRAVVIGTTDKSCKLPSAASEVFMGIAERIHSVVDPIDGNADEIAPFSTASVGYHGRWLAEVEQAVSAGDPVFFRHTGGTAGAWRMDNDGGNADQVANARWETSAGVGELAELLLNG